LRLLACCLGVCACDTPSICLAKNLHACAAEKPQEGLILRGPSGGRRTETVRRPASLASQGVSLGEPASRRRSPFYCGSGDGPDELSPFYFVVIR
jgi:hypothetical protein